MRHYWRRFRTLKFKLTALHTAAVGILLALVCTVVLFARERDLRQRMDERLKDRALILVAERDFSTPATGSDTNAVTPPRHVRQPSSRFPGCFSQIRRSDGTIMEVHDLPHGAVLPLSAAAAKARNAGLPVFETIAADELAAEENIADGIRLLTMFHEAGQRGEDGFYVQIGARTGTMEESIHHLRRVVIVAVLSAMLVVSVISWNLVGRSLAPLAQVARMADEIQPYDMVTRFHPPATTDEVGELVARINGMLERLSDSFLSHERFIADAAHELKTPLAVLLGEAQVLMQQGRTPEDYARFVANVQDEVRLLAQTVDSLLTLARAEAGLPTMEVAPVSINDAVIEAVERCSAVAAQNEVRLVPTLAEPGPDGTIPMVIGDAGLLRVMIGNLLRNAIRYSPPADGVQVTVRRLDHLCRVEVRDHGPGIPTECLDRVFDRFFRVPDAGSSFKGIGLGLTIVRGVARLHGGSVQAVNETDGGCRFTVNLPLRREPERHT